MVSKRGIGKGEGGGRERAREKVGKKEGKGIGKKVLGWENTRLNVNANDPFAIKAPRLLDLSQLFAFVPFYYP